MTDWLDFLPLYTRTEDDIRSDMDADANAGLAPTDPAWVDTRQGSWFHMVTQPFVIEAARIHDQLSTLPAVSFIEFAYGEYLDYHAQALNTERIAAVAASVDLVFAAPVGTVVQVGTEVSTVSTDPAVEPITFKTIVEGAVNGPLDPPAGLAGAANSNGTLPAGNRFYRVAANDAAGTTLASAEIEVILASEGAAVVSWDEVVDALSYTLYVGTVTGAEDEQVTVTGTSVTDDGTVAWVPGVVPAANATGGKVSVQAAASQPGAAGNVAADSLTEMVTTNTAVVSVTNPQPAADGADVENDQQLQTRLLDLQEGDGPGDVGDYLRWALGYPGVGAAQIYPNFNGPGTVGVLVMADASGNPTSQVVIDGLQAQLDPYPGQGGGIAPIDHIVTVMTPTIVPVDVTAAVTFRQGYSYDGAANTIPIRQNVVDALTAYIQGLGPGETVLADHVKAVFFQVEGVYDVVVTAPAADIPISSTSTPLQRAQLQTVTLD